MKSVLSILLISTSAFASGFRCESHHTRELVSVRLYNHVSPESGTRTPAALIISGEESGTLLVRKNDEIRKHVQGTRVQYVANGNERLGAKSVILQIAFREGLEVLAEGETVDGELVLVGASGSRTVTVLSCSRYLKGE